MQYSSSSSSSSPSSSSLSSSSSSSLSYAVQPLPSSSPLHFPPLDPHAHWSPGSPSSPPSPSSPALLLPADVAYNGDPNRCYCCHSVFGMASRKNFMGHMNQRHRDMSAAHITALMQQRFAILDCHCGHHCISRTGLLMHLSRCQVPRPEGRGIPPRHPLHHDEPLPQVALLPIPSVTVQPAIINHKNLSCLFRQPVYKFYHTWKDQWPQSWKHFLGQDHLGD